MDIEQLKTFLTLAETKSFSQTAKRMLLAQSTISKRIHELEKELGEALFLRERTGAVLTTGGNALYEYAEQMVNMEEKLKKQLQRKEQYSGCLVLGTVYAYFDVGLSGLLQTFMEEHPDVSVELRFGHTRHMLSELSQALIDVAFTHHPFQHPEYLCQDIGQDDIILVTDAQNTAFCGGISHEAIRDLPFLSSNFLYDTTRSWLFPKGRQFQLEIDIARNVIPFLLDSKWYTLLARKLVEKELQSGQLIEIPISGRQIPPVRYYMSHRRDSAQQKALQAWLTFCEEIGLVSADICQGKSL